MQLETNKQVNKQTLLQNEDEEKQNEMESNLVTLDNLNFDIPSEAEVFYKNNKG